MKNQNFINYMTDLVEKNIDTEILQYLKSGLKLDSEGDDYIKFTEKQREIVKQLVKTLDATKTEIMEKIKQDLKR
jgi:hypothetical protein